jgi:hypothetical protein
MGDGSDALRRVMEEKCRISRTLNTLNVEYDSN